MSPKCEFEFQVQISRAGIDPRTSKMVKSHLRIQSGKLNFKCTNLRNFAAYALPGGGSPKKFGWGVRRASGGPYPAFSQQNMCDFDYPISDLILSSRPYFRLDSHPILFA